MPTLIGRRYSLVDAGVPTACGGGAACGGTGEAYRWRPAPRGVTTTPTKGGRWGSSNGSLKASNGEGEAAAGGCAVVVGWANVFSAGRFGEPSLPAQGASGKWRRVKAWEAVERVALMLPSG